MSHFSVLVITKTKPSDGELAAILQPWHEFECTGTDDQYVVDVDVTEVMRNGYTTDTVHRLKDPSGTYHEPWLDRFFRDPTPEELVKLDGVAGSGVSDGIIYQSQDWKDGRGYRVKVRYVPDGWEEVEVPYSEIRDMTFRQFVAYQTSEDKEVFQVGDSPLRLDPDKHKFGFTVIDERGEVVKVVDRTNPNRKWDWWQVGGRYTGKFAPNYDPDKDPANVEKCWICRGTGLRDDDLGREHRKQDPTYKCNGCRGSGKTPVWPTKRVKVESDQIQVNDIPLQELADEKERQAAKTYDEFHRIVAGRPVPVWSEVRERHPGDVEAARKEYRENPVIVDLNKSDEFRWDFDVKLATLSREEYLARARTRAITAFAVVKDGQWYEQGKMGWWGAVSNEIDDEVWQTQLNSMLQALDPTDWITVVDCHI